MKIDTFGPLLRKMALFLALNALIFNGILWATSPTGYNNTVLRHTWDFFHAKSGDDSWSTMAFAYNYVSHPHTTPLYTEIFFHRKIKFQYPPSALLAFGALNATGVQRVRFDDEYFGPWPSINDLLAWIFVLAMIIAVAALFRIQFKKSIDSSGNNISFVLCAVISAGFTLTFYPVMKACTLGQIQVWLNSIFAVALLAWILRRKAISGVLIGLICLIKPHFGIFLIWALVRRERAFVIAFAITVGVGLAASVSTFGWADHIDYLRVLSYLGERGEAYYPNQSVNGLLNRLMSVGDPQHYNNLKFEIAKFAPFDRWVYGATVVSSLAILLAAITWQNSAKNRAVDFSRMAVSITIASPIAWEHHYGILLPIFAIMLPIVLHDRGRTFWLTVSYVLVSNFIPITNMLAPTYWNFSQSYLFFGAIILLVLMYSPSAAPPIAIENRNNKAGQCA
jgi:alpha-1,2-mannosyltransferase